MADREKYLSNNRSVIRGNAYNCIENEEVESSMPPISQFALTKYSHLEKSTAVQEEAIQLQETPRSSIIRHADPEAESQSELSNLDATGHYSSDITSEAEDYTIQINHAGNFIQGQVQSRRISNHLNFVDTWSFTGTQIDNSRQSATFNIESEELGNGILTTDGDNLYLSLPLSWFILF